MFNEAPDSSSMASPPWGGCELPLPCTRRRPPLPCEPISHTLPASSSKHAALVTNYRWVCPPAPEPCSNSHPLSSGFSTSYLFIGVERTGGKYLDHRGACYLSIKSEAHPSASVLQRKKHSRVRAPETHQHTSLQVSSPPTPREIIILISTLFFLNQLLWFYTRNHTSRCELFRVQQVLKMSSPIPLHSGKQNNSTLPAPVCDHHP